MRRLLSLFAAALACASFAQTDLAPGRKDEVLKGIEDVVLTRAFNPGVEFTKWPEHIAARKEKIDGAKTEADFVRVVNEALREFGLSHFRLMTPRVASQRGQTSAIGIGASLVKEDDGLRIRGLAEEGPAKASGLEAGDVIVSVDGKKAEDPTMVEGEEGKTLKLEVKKSSGETKALDVVLKKYSTVRKETLTWPAPDTAVLRIYTFSTGYGRTNIEQLIQEANSRAKFLVLDLRSNGGGAVNNLNHLLSLLMPDGTEYGTFISRRLADDYKVQNPNAPFTTEAIAAWNPNKTKTRQRGANLVPFAGKIAVLTNRGSASASEICTAALKERRGAIQVGQQTAGAVLASTYAGLPGGFSLQYPVSDYITVKGERLEKNPRKPDAEVTGLPADGKDPVVDKAIELLKAGG